MFATQNANGSLDSQPPFPCIYKISSSIAELYPSTSKDFASGDRHESAKRLRVKELFVKAVYSRLTNCDSLDTSVANGGETHCRNAMLSFSV